MSALPNTTRSLDEIAQTLANLAIHEDLTDDERGACDDALAWVSWLEQAGQIEEATCGDCDRETVLLTANCICGQEDAA